MLPSDLVGVDVAVVADTEADQAVGVHLALGQAGDVLAIHLEHDAVSLHRNAERVYLAAVRGLLGDGGVSCPGDHGFGGGSLVRRGLELREAGGIGVVAGLGPFGVIEGAGQADDEMEYVGRLGELELLGGAAVGTGVPAGWELAAVDDAVEIVAPAAGGYQDGRQEQDGSSVAGETGAAVGRLGQGGGSPGVTIPGGALGCQAAESKPGKRGGCPQV